jgi:GrpB-like predicted nucleotidyltransferase (UPF0157 family)
MLPPAIQIVDDQGSWGLVFEGIRERIWPNLHDMASSIEHVGSTSVPGLPGKPKIDIDVIIKGLDCLSGIVRRLEALGYQYRGNLGIEGRDVFDPPAESPAHNLCVCLEEGIHLRNHLTVRDHLRSHANDASEYASLKRRLAHKYPNDRSSYLDGKTDFIISILAKHGFAASEVEEVREANRKIRLSFARDASGGTPSTGEPD